MLVSVLVALAAWALDGWPSAVAACIITAATWQGLRLGAVELAGLAAGTLLALGVAGPIGRAIEPGIGALTGLGGLVKRGISIGCVALALMALGGLAGRLILRSVAAQDSVWRRRNTLVGGVIGFVQGVALVIGLAWAVISVLPIAAAQAASRRAESSPRDMYVRGRVGDGMVLGLGEDLLSTLVGRIAAATNPLTDLRALALAEAFAEVSRDPYALKWLLASEPMVKLRTFESYNTAAVYANGDVELMGFVTGEGVDAATVASLVYNDTILMILDKTTIAADIEPLVPALERAVMQARDQIGRGPPELIDPTDGYSPGMR